MENYHIIVNQNVALSNSINKMVEEAQWNETQSKFKKSKADSFADDRYYLIFLYYLLLLVLVYFFVTVNPPVYQLWLRCTIISIGLVFPFVIIHIENQVLETFYFFIAMVMAKPYQRNTNQPYLFTWFRPFL